MKIKTSQATGAVLDWLVAKAEEPIGGYKAWVQEDFDKGGLVAGTRADDWLTVGPIIEREKIDLLAYMERDGLSMAWRAVMKDVKAQYGPTPLIAAMRCYCCSKLGDEMEVPLEVVP